MRLRAAIKRAVRDAIRVYAGFGEAECDVTPPPGKPHPRAGKWFVAVWDGGQTSQHTMSVDSYLTTMVTVTMKVGDVPFDRLGTRAIDQAADPTDGLNERAEMIAAELFNHQWDVSGQATALMSGDPTGTGIYNGVLEAIKPTALSSPAEVNHDWFGVVPQPTQVNVGRHPLGYKVDLTFVTRCMQPIDGGTF